MQGLHESSSDALRIIQITTVMVVVLLGWAFITLLERGGHLPPPPTLPNLAFSEDALGWPKDTAWPNITPIAILVGFGHSFLAMSGEESLAQVYREIESPRHRRPETHGRRDRHLQPGAHRLTLPGSTPRRLWDTTHS
jgi:hypothetical protein